MPGVIPIKKHAFAPNRVEPTWCVICGFPWDEFNMHPKLAENDQFDPRIAALEQRLREAKAALRDAMRGIHESVWLDSVKAVLSPQQQEGN